MAKTSNRPSQLAMQTKPITSLRFTGDLDCVRLCNDAMQTPLYDINDDSDLGDIINDHADRAMTPAEVAEFNEWAATQNYRITSSPSR